jgi:hypothetical protein
MINPSICIAYPRAILYDQSLKSFSSPDNFTKKIIYLLKSHEKYWNQMFFFLCITEVRDSFQSVGDNFIRMVAIITGPLVSSHVVITVGTIIGVI